MVDFAAYKEEFDASFSKVKPEDFVKKMEGLGYNLKDIEPRIKLGKRIRYAFGAIKCMASNLKALVGYIIEEPSAICDECREYVSDCSLIWYLHTSDEGIRTIQKLGKMTF